MHTLYGCLYLAIFLLSVFMSIKWFYIKYHWRRNKKAEVEAAETFRCTTVPLGRLTQHQHRSLEKLIQRESLDISSNSTFRAENLNPDIFRIPAPLVNEKDWLHSNTDVKVSHTLNGFELLIPSMARGLLQNTYVDEANIVFYDNIAIMVSASGLFDIFEESIVRLPYTETGLEITVTPIESWIDGYTSEINLALPPANGQRVIRALDSSRAILFQDHARASVYALLIGSTGILSLIIAGSLTLTGIAGLLEGFAHSSPTAQFIALLIAIWMALISSFLLYEYFKFNKQPALSFDRTEQCVFISQFRNSKPIRIPWDKVKIRINSSAYRLVGIAGRDFTTYLTVYDEDLVSGPSISFWFPNFKSAISTWRTLQLFVSGELTTIAGIPNNLPKYQPGDPPWDGMYLFNRRITTTFWTLEFLPKVMHFVLFFLTLGPLPYLLSTISAKSRIRQAKHRLLERRT